MVSPIRTFRVRQSPQSEAPRRDRSQVPGQACHRQWVTKQRQPLRSYRMLSKAPWEPFRQQCWTLHRRFSRPHRQDLKRPIHRCQMTKHWLPRPFHQDLNGPIRLPRVTKNWRLLQNLPVRHCRKTLRRASLIPLRTGRNRLATIAPGPLRTPGAARNATRTTQTPLCRHGQRTCALALP